MRFSRDAWPGDGHAKALTRRREDASDRKRYPFLRVFAPSREETRYACPMQPVAAARPDERGLVDRLRAGDERAFEELVDNHAAPLLAVTRRILRDEEEARDA